MEKVSMDNEATTLGRHSSIDSKEILNAQSDLPNSGIISSVIDQSIAPYTSPTLLSRSLLSTLCHTKTVVAFTLYTSIVVIFAILTVRFTTPKAPSRTCQLIFKTVTGKITEQNSRPRSVAVGDFNNDNWLDIVVTNSGADKFGIFLADRNGNFASQNTYSTGSGSRPYSVALGDFNNDHRLDIAIANYGTNNIGLYFGSSDGTFERQNAFSIGSSRPMSIAAGDLNNDNCIDIVVANYGTNNVGILLGDGNGNFTSQKTYSTGYDSLPYFVKIGDFNNDNQLDIIVANYGTSNVGVLLGYGNGSFASQMTFSTGRGSHPYSIAVAHFNKDNQLDIVVANSGTDNIGVLLGYGNGTFAVQSTYSISVHSFPCSVAVGDFNNDNRVDIVVSNNGNDSISVLLGNGDGNFAPPSMHSTSSQSNPFSVATGDFNNDNRSDIVVVNSATNSILVLIGYAKKPLKNPPTYSTGSGSDPNQVSISDFNKDNYSDLAVVNIDTNNIGIFLGNGKGSFGKQMIYSTGNLSRPYALTIDDFNNDNHLDIAVANLNANDVCILFGYGNGTFASIIRYALDVFSSPIAIAAGDFNKDNQLDIIVANYGLNSIGIAFGYGNGTFISGATYSTGIGSRPLYVVVGDFNNDHQLDVAVANRGTDSIGVFLGDGTGKFATLKTYSTGESSSPYCVSIGDFNTDDQLDIAVANSASHNVGIFFGYGNGTFATEVTYATGPGSSPRWVTVADLNNDGWLDMAVANVGTNTLGVFLGYGDGTFASQILFPVFCVSLAAGDLNKDHRLDIVAASDNAIAVLIGHDNTSFNRSTSGSADSSPRLSSLTVVRTKNESRLDLDDDFSLGDYYADFERQTSYSTGSGSLPYSTTVGDFNNDTLLDIAIANSRHENVGILLGYGDGTFTLEKTYETGSGSRPQHVVSGDFNNDKKLDIAVTNPVNDTIGVLLGYGNGTFAREMTILTGSGSNPQSVATADFNNDNRLDLVVANEGTGTIGLIWGFEYASFGSGVTYSTGNASNPYSIATGDFNGDNRLDIVVGNRGSNNIGILLGYGDGTFAPQMTFGNVAASRPRAIAVGDFNNDNQLDITVADWGLDSIGVILGYNNGTFGAHTLYSSGTGSRPVAIAVDDLNNDHRLDIFVANFGTNTIGVLIGYGDGTFANVITYSTGILAGTYSVAASDLNNDRRLDIVVANRVANTVGILFGYGDGTFASVISYTTGLDSTPLSAAVGDFNNDLQPDIAVALVTANSVGIFLGYGNGVFASVVTYSAGPISSPVYLRFGDFNNDNQLDIALANVASDSIGLLFGHGDGKFTSVVQYATDTGVDVFRLTIGDFNNDSRLDIAYVDDINNTINVFLGLGIQPFGGQTVLLTVEDSRPSSVAVGDFNNDQWLDIAIANYGTGNVGVLFGRGNGTFGNMTTYLTGIDSHPLSIAVGDFNKDSSIDIAVANSGTDNVGVFLGLGNGTFASQKTYATGTASRPVSVAVKDFDKDNCLDIVVANNGTNYVGMLIGHGDGTFETQSVYSVGYNSRPNWVAFGDFDNDSWIDIVVVNYATGSVEILSETC